MHYILAELLVVNEPLKVYAKGGTMVLNTEIAKDGTFRHVWMKH